MAFPPRSLPDLVPAYQPQLHLPHTTYHNAPAQQLYAPYGVNETSAFTVQAQRSGGPVATTSNHNLHSSTLPAWQPGLAHFGAVLAGTNQPAYASAASTGPASSMRPPDRPRKRKAATLRADDWEPYKKRILDLHIEQKRPLSKVRELIEEEYGFKAELRQYRSRVSQWGKDKNVKTQEMQAIVRKRQKRKLVETDKAQLVFEVRGSDVELQKIERWMKRHHVVDSALYAPSPAAPTPSDVGCYTISERGSPAMTTTSVYSPVASVLSPGGVYLTAQSPQIVSPALSVSSLVRPQTSAFAGQSPALTYRSLPNLQLGFLYSPGTSGGAVDISAQTRYKRDEEDRLRDQLFIAETTFVSSPLEILGMLYELGSVLIDQGRYKAAEDAVRSLIEIHESQRGGSDDNADALRALDLLGQALEYQGLYTKAERLFRRALQGKEMVLTTDHLDTLTSMNNLARVVSRQGRFEEAKEQNVKTQALCKRVLGPDHVLTLTSMSNSARVLDKLGRYKEAALMHSETLALQERVLGLEHPTTLTSMNNVARVLCRQGRCKEAEAKAKKTLALYKKVLGLEHPDTLVSQSNLAEVRADQGRYEEAEAIRRETLVLRQKVLGPEHPDTLTSMLYLGYMLHKQGKYKEAEATQSETLAMCKKVLGPEHPNTVASMESLTSVLYNQGKHKEAESTGRETFALYEKMLGLEHPYTLISMHSLALALGGQGRYKEAQAMHRERLAMCKKVLGPKHPDTLMSVRNFQMSLEVRGRFQQARTP